MVCMLGGMIKDVTDGTVEGFSSDNAPIQSGCRIEIAARMTTVCDAFWCEEDGGPRWGRVRYVGEVWVHDCLHQVSATWCRES